MRSVTADQGLEKGMATALNLIFDLLYDGVNLRLLFDLGREAHMHLRIKGGKTELGHSDGQHVAGGSFEKVGTELLGIVGCTGDG